jgi:hypothetical protein
MDYFSISVAVLLFQTPAIMWRWALKNSVVSVPLVAFSIPIPATVCFIEYLLMRQKFLGAALLFLIMMISQLIAFVIYRDELRITSALYVKMASTATLVGTVWGGVTSILHYFR